VTEATAGAVPNGDPGGSPVNPISGGVDVTRPSSARLYDYFLGGTNNFPADQAMGEKLRSAIPDFADAVMANRGFHGRATVWLAREGVRQFIDIGSGLPTRNNTHESAHRVAPGARVVYADIDPLVAEHGNELLADDGTTTVITADVREPDRLLDDPRLRELIDLGQPVGLLMTALLHFVTDEQDPWGLVARYMARLAPGSYLVLSHGTYDNVPPSQVQAGTDAYATTSEPLRLRTRAEVERFFQGLELVPPYEGAEPGVTYVGLWGAEDIEAADSDGSRAIYCGVARRP
jgi:O-methyltransferase involved in polyketide biosynthesis